MPVPDEFLHFGNVQGWFHSDSPLEDRMLALLVDAPFIGTRSQYRLGATWEQALHVLKAEAEKLDRCQCVVFPQLKVGSYFVDFMVSVAPIAFGKGFLTFFIECDGKAYHDEISGRE